MNKNTEMYHAAINILSNRADQLGLDDDELMHYGRKGMKWGKDIFATDPNSTKKAVYGFMDVVTGADKRKQDQENKQHDADFILNRAKFDRELQLKQKRNELYEKPREFQKAVNNSDHARLGRIFGTNQYLTEKINRSNPDLTRDLAEGRNVKVEGGYVLPKDKDNPYYHTITDEEKANIDYNNRLETNKQDAIEKYSDDNEEFTDEDRARGQAVREAQRKQRETDAIRARGQAVREAQRQQRETEASPNNDDLNEKKKELLKKVKAERDARNQGYNT